MGSCLGTCPNAAESLQACQKLCDATSGCIHTSYDAEGQCFMRSQGVTGVESGTMGAFGCSKIAESSMPKSCAPGVQTDNDATCPVQMFAGDGAMNTLSPAGD